MKREKERPYWISHSFYCCSVKSHFPFIRGSLTGFGVPWKKAEAKEPRIELGAPRAASTLPGKRRLWGNVSGRTTTWIKNMHVLCSLWKIISCRWSADLWWWCLDFFPLPVDLLGMWMLPWQDFLAQPLLRDRAPKVSQIELIQFFTRFQDFHSGIKEQLSRAVLCWHGLKALRNEFQLCTCAGFHGNGHHGLGQGYQTYWVPTETKDNSLSGAFPKTISLFPGLASDSHWKFSI